MSLDISGATIFSGPGPVRTAAPRQSQPSTLPIGRKAQGRSLRLNPLPDSVFLGLAHADPVADFFEGSSASSADVVALGGRADGNAG